MDQTSAPTCPACGYDLCGHDARLPRCPECAHQVTEADLAAPPRYWRTAAGRACLALLASPLPAAVAGVLAGLALNQFLTWPACCGVIWCAAARSVAAHNPERTPTALAGAALLGLTLAAPAGTLVAGLVVLAMEGR